jgi:hypothetical protein
MLDDPRLLLIAEEIDLGPKVTQRLANWGFTTLGDLTLVGMYEEYQIPDEERTHVRYYLPALADMRGIGPMRIRRIRLALRVHGLRIADEGVVNHWQPLDK